MGLAMSLASQSYPPKATFIVNDIPDLTGKVIIVTGGNSGIGKSTIKALVSHNAKVYMASRNFKSSQDAIDEIKAETGKEAIFLELDLASLDSVKKSAETFLSKESELHILFNNAGLMWPSMSEFTAEGYDIQFGVHVVGHHLFTQLLIPALRAGSKTSLDGKSRVVTTSSAGAYLDSIHWDTLVDGPARNARSSNSQYYQSKFAQVVWARELARRYGDQDIISVSLNPGNIHTNLTRTLKWGRRFVQMFIYPVEPYGALTQLWGATSPEIINNNGRFLIPWARFGPTPSTANDLQTGEKLWNWLEEQVAKKGW